MARKTISVADLFDDVEINLWGDSKFRLRPRTRSIEEKVIAKQKEFEGLPEDTPPEDAIAPIAALLDILLEPVPEEGSKKVSAKTVIVREYKADKIGLSHVLALSERLVEVANERPT
jgi:hypothetical protein